MLIYYYSTTLGLPVGSVLVVRLEYSWHAPREGAKKLGIKRM